MSSGRKRTTDRHYSAEDQALNQISKEVITVSYFFNSLGTVNSGYSINLFLTVNCIFHYTWPQCNWNWNKDHFTSYF